MKSNLAILGLCLMSAPWTFAQTGTGSSSRCADCSANRSNLRRNSARRDRRRGLELQGNSFCCRTGWWQSLAPAPTLAFRARPHSEISRPNSGLAAAARASTAHALVAAAVSHHDRAAHVAAGGVSQIDHFGEGVSGVDLPGRRSPAFGRS